MDVVAPLDLARICEFAEAAAWADLYRAAPPEFARSFGIGTEHLGSAVLLIAEKLPAVLFNRVIGLGIDEPITEASIEDILTRYGRVGVNRFAIQPAPPASPADFSGWLSAVGLRHVDNWAKVYRGVEPPPLVTTDLRIEAVQPDDANAFAAAFIEGYEVPEFVGPWVASTIGREGWSHYVAVADNVPVATGALFVRDRVGWLGMAATVPAYRRRGGQGALMARRINDAIALGCEWLVTETGEDTAENPNPSYHNMLKTGFKLAYLRPNYIP